MAEINERWGGVEVLVNNAGVAYRAVVEHVREAEAQRSWRSILTGRWSCSAGVAAHAGAAADPAAAYHAEYAEMSELIGRRLTRTGARPERVAAAILHTMQQRRPPLRVPATWAAHGFGWLRRLLPRSWYHWVWYRSLPHVRRWG